MATTKNDEAVKKARHHTKTSKTVSTNAAAAAASNGEILQEQPKRRGRPPTKASNDKKKPPQQGNNKKKDPPGKSTATANSTTKEEEPTPGAKSSTPQEPIATTPNADSPSSSDTNVNHKEDDDRAACCLCHCALDYSDRAAFFEPDRKKEVEEQQAAASDDDGDDVSESNKSLYYQLTDPYLPRALFDPMNALVYCDSCNRLYHQKCHFVPLTHLPRGQWHCLVCTTSLDTTGHSKIKPQHGSSTKKSAEKIKKKTGNRAPHKEPPFTRAQLRRMFQSPPPPEKEPLITSAAYTTAVDTAKNTTDNSNSNNYHLPMEKQWEIETCRAKAELWHKTLTQVIPQSIQSQLGNWRQAQTALDTLTRTKQNRQHYLKATTSSSGRGSQELAQTLVKLTGAKLKLRQIILNLDQIRTIPERHIDWMHQWCKDDCKTVVAVPPASAQLQGTTTTMTEPTTNQTATLTGKEVVSSSRNNFIKRIVFPFGQYPHRSIPRTAEKEEIEQELHPNNKNNDKETKGGTNIPREIVMTTAQTRNEDKEQVKATTTTNKDDENESKLVASKEKELAKDDASSGVSLDDLKCCVCLMGDATDENDLLLCDSQGCFRAFHMQCLHPAVTMEEVEAAEGEDWFCPLCQGLAECMHMVQSHYMGDEWEQRRLEKRIAEEAAANKTKKEAKKAAKTSKKSEQKNESEEVSGDEKEAGDNIGGEDVDDDSFKSWDKPEQVFPRAEWEYEAALQLKAGNRNDQTKELLNLALGDGEDENENQQGGSGGDLDYGTDYSDDEEKDGHFDLDSYQIERRKEYEDLESEDDASDASDHSSQATLVDMSSVELNISKDELKALSEASSSESEDEDGGGGGQARRSRRLRHRERQSQEPETKDAGVDFDPKNIIQGKRRRKPVDYRRLNEALFGDLDEEELANIDDKEDFRVATPKKTSSGSSDEDDSDDDSANDNSDDESASSDRASDKKKLKKKTKKAITKKRRRSLDKNRNSSDDNESGNDAEDDDSSDEGKKVSGPGKGPAKTKKRTSDGPATTKTKTPPKKSATGAKSSSRKAGGKGTKQSGDTKQANPDKKKLHNGRKRAKKQVK